VKSQPQLFRAVHLGLLVLAGVFWSSQSIAQKTDVLTTIADRHVKECSLHLAAPADWVVSANPVAKGCDIDALGPDEPDRCGKMQDLEGEPTRTFCDEEKKIRIEIRAGSIDQLAKTPGIEDVRPYDSALQVGDFLFADGLWQIDSLSRNAATKLSGKGRNLVYGPWIWRKQFEEGYYCCSIRKWQALVDLPGHRVAWVSVNWDEDEANVTRFLQSIR